MDNDRRVSQKCDREVGGYLLGNNLHCYTLTTTLLVYSPHSIGPPEFHQELRKVHTLLGSLTLQKYRRRRHK